MIGLAIPKAKCPKCRSENLEREKSSGLINGLELVRVMLTFTCKECGYTNRKEIKQKMEEKMKQNGFDTKEIFTKIKVVKVKK